MDKATIAEIRKIVQNPVKFIEKRIDACTLFLIKHLESGSWLFGAIILGAMAFVVLPSECHTYMSRRSLSSSTQVNSDVPNEQFGPKSRLSSLVIGIKQSESELKAHKAPVWTDVSDRIRRFPLAAVVSVRPADATSKVKLAFSLKFVDQAVYYPVFSDAFLDASNKPIVSYGVYFDTHSATKPIWEPAVTADARQVIYRRLAAYLLGVKHYFFAQPSSKRDVEDTVTRTIELIQNETSQTALTRAQYNFPIGRSASFNMPSAERRVRSARALDEVATSEQPSASSGGLQANMSRLVSSVQTSFVFRIDILKTLIIKIEQ